MNSKNNLMAPPMLVINPKLPKQFDNKGNMSRSAQELDKWWDKPFAVLLTNGEYVVRCLDGGAWDRPTYYGVASDLATAQALADDKFNKWRKLRAQPIVKISDDGMCTVVREPQRPDEKSELLYKSTDQADAGRWLEEHNTLQR